MIGSLISFGMAVLSPAMHAIESHQKVRKAAAAGEFYPADAAELSQMINRMLAQAAPVVSGEIVAAVVPHAGYEYSGPVAAYTYAALKGHRYRRVIVIAPSHCELFNTTSIYDGDAYATPLGDVKVDVEFARRLARTDRAITLSDKGHRANGNRGEHAIEVQLPWLQTVLDKFELVPVVMGNHSYEASRALGVALARLVQADEKPDETLVLASSDLSHHHSYDDAETLDCKTLQALKNWDYLSMSRNFSGQVWEACGGAPIVAAMIYAERMGATQAQVLHHSNSGDVNGDRARVVGYSSDVFLKTADAPAAVQEFSLQAQEKRELLNLARRTIEHIVRRHELYEPVTSADPALHRDAGAFVTLTRGGHLRGCVGYVSAVKPLNFTVRDTAALAAMRDTRFQPVGTEELAQIRCEISVLSPLRHVGNLDDIVVGRDGLLIKNGHQEGLLLPQVPMEHHWDRTRFLEEACIKAGMDKHSWEREDTDIFRFTAVVFEEKEQNSKQAAQSK